MKSSFNKINQRYATEIFISLISLITISTYTFLIIGGPLQLDEFATWWVTKEDHIRAVSGTFPYASHPLFYLSTWIVVHFLGDSIFALRLISLISLVTIIFLFGRYYSRSSRVLSYSICAILIFSYAPLISQLNSRPYFLGFLFALSSLLILINYRSKLSHYASLLPCTLALLCHQSFATAFVIPICFILTSKRGQSLKSIFIAVKLAVCSALIILAVRFIFPVSIRPEDSKDNFFYTATRLSDILTLNIFEISFFQMTTILMVIALISVKPYHRKRLLLSYLSSASTKLGISIVILTGITILMLSLISGVSFFSDRYLLTAIVGCLCLHYRIIMLLRGLYLYSTFILLLLFGAPPLISSNNAIEKWELAAENIESKRNAIAFMFPGHLISIKNEYNQTKYLSSAWTAPIDYYTRKNNTPLVMPIVADSVNSTLDPILNYPWININLNDYDHIFVVLRRPLLRAEIFSNNLIQKITSNGYKSYDCGDGGNLRLLCYAKH